MCVQVDFANRDSSGRVTSIGGPGGGGWLGQPWRLNVARVLELMAADYRWVVFTVDEQVTGTTVTRRRALVTSQTRNGATFLTSTPDGTPRNNLDVLPGGNLDLPDMTEPSFPERPYLRPPQLAEVLRGNRAVAPLRGGSYPTQPAPNIGIRFRAPWPAALAVSVNRVEVPEVPPSSGYFQPDLDAEGRGWFFVQEVTGLAPGTELQNWTIRVVPPVGLRQPAVRIRVWPRSLNQRCRPQDGDGRLLQTRLDDLERGNSSRAMQVDAGSTAKHPRLWDYSAADRAQLATAITNFLTPEVLSAHHSLDHVIHVVDDHRLYLSRLEDYLWVAGLGGKYVPLPYWDPTEWIPDEFKGVVAGAAPLENPKPGIGLPGDLWPPALCTIPTLEELWNAMRPWHNEVHATVGGAMRTVETNSPAALIFWPWHAYVDNVYKQWELCG